MVGAFLQIGAQLTSQALKRKRIKENIIFLHECFSLRRGIKHEPSKTQERGKGKYIPPCLLQRGRKAPFQKHRPARSRIHSIPSDRVIVINPDNEAITLKAVKGYADQSSPLTSFKQLCWGGKKSHNSISLEKSIPH